MNERPAPSPPDTPPPSPLQAGRGGPAHRVPLVLLCQETGISPPHPLHSTTRTPPPLSSHRPTPVPGRRGTGLGDSGLDRSPLEGTLQSVRAQPPPPPPAPRPRSRSRRCPRHRRPALSSLGKLQAHVSPGAGRGRQWGGGGGERHRDPRTFGQSGRGDSSTGVVPGRAGLPSWTMGPPGAPRRFAFTRTLGRGRGIRGSDEETPSAFEGKRGWFQWSEERLPPWDDTQARFGSETAR